MCEQMKTIMRYYLILVRMGVIRNKIKVTNAVKYVEKRELFHTIDRNSNYYSHYIEKGGYLTKIPILSINVKEMILIYQRIP